MDLAPRGSADGTPAPCGSALPVQFMESCHDQTLGFVVSNTVIGEEE